MPTVSVTGATGFIGRHLIPRLLARSDVTVRALVHDAQEAALPRAERLIWVRGDLGDVASVSKLLEPGCDLVNLAFPANWSREQHVSATMQLAKLAADVGVRRVVHCSTAVVTGRAPARRVTEATVPEPATEYESAKLAIESAWREFCSGRTELIVLRPTAVFGPEGANLLKLAAALTTGMRFSNYLRSSLFGHRRMNLVHVGNVAAAIEFLLDRPSSGAGEIYIVSDDEHPANNFRDVEQSLMRAWGIDDYAVAPLPVPKLVLSALLRLTARSNVDPDRIYDASKLLAAGLKKPYRFETGLDEFASWYASSRQLRADRPA